MASYTMDQLETVAGVSARTLRQWIKLRLVPSPLGRGRAARYDQRHADRARAVRALRAQRVPLRTIRQRLASMSAEELRTLVPPAPRPTDTTGVPLPPPAPSYPASPFDLVTLMDGLWLLVNHGNGPLPRRVADEIYRHYAMPIPTPRR